jgi:membrane glycosyltransferase
MDKEPSQQNPSRQAEDLNRHASQSQRGVAAEFVDFLMHNKKWWLAPVILVLLLVGLLVALGTSSAAPFIYTLF